MNTLQALAEQIEQDKSLIFLVISNKRKQGDSPDKITISPFYQREALCYQVSRYFAKQVFHENVAGFASLIEGLSEQYKNITIYAVEADYQILRGKKGNLKIIKKPPTKTQKIGAHNKEKNYILKDGTRYDFLVALDIQSADGKVKEQRYNKFVQINKYLEIVAPAAKKLAAKGGQIHIVDFGCGKAYLTFALYYYFHQVLHLPCRITGVDLKQDVIDFCAELAASLGFSQMEFVCGDINDFGTDRAVDMVVSLHACDTATDAALEKAILWGSKVIIAVPCCQHELFDKIHNPLFEPLQRYGILNDKLATLVTDTMRGLVLEQKGYHVQIMEFTPLEHTAKNVLIKAEYTGKASEKACRQYEEWKGFWGAAPKIDEIIENGDVKNAQNAKRRVK